MPREQINERKTSDDNQLELSWNRIGWVQAGVYPPGWKDTGDAVFVELYPNDIDKLIKNLRKAKRQAYGDDE
ncbi:hypothetical protein KPL76_06235 [Subtercola sp. PAMC28395]|uniref:hypothetical protein n=1 Tax=Subtercola sp. PAMC28395 TaxID=2846775 RepID=UPI001C0DEBBD|nr:hypothetical protein [Subtercola sp. PAMC28395]QWT24952.1 hypothetical protein KPL76_06235 [Subtercola sp. PAMC28395]